MENLKIFTSAVGRISVATPFSREFIAAVVHTCMVVEDADSYRVAEPLALAGRTAA